MKYEESCGLMTGKRLARIQKLRQHAVHPKNSKWKYEKAGSSSCKTREGLSSDEMKIQEIKDEDSDEESVRKTQCSADIESARTGPRIVITHLKAMLIRVIRGWRRRVCILLVVSMLLIGWMNHFHKDRRLLRIRSRNLRAKKNKKLVEEDRDTVGERKQKEK